MGTRNLTMVKLGNKVFGQYGQWGTRNLTMVKLGNKVFGQYGQWDGYPSGQGVRALEFMKSRFVEAHFRDQFEKAEFLTYEKADEIRSTMVDHSHLDRDCGAKILDYIQNVAGAPQLYNSIEFAKDSLFCEWGYMVDLDERKLRCFKGFNESLLEDGQFFKHMEEGDGGYQPIREIHAFSFEELATLDLAKFCEILDPPEVEV